MPHIIIEHDKITSSNIDIHNLATELHQTLSEQETVSLEAIKTRTIEVDNVIVANGEKNQMVHVEVKLLSGRSDELKKIMAENLFHKMKHTKGLEDCKLSLNISELGVYKK